MEANGVYIHTRLQPGVRERQQERETVLNGFRIGLVSSPGLGQM